MVAARKPRRRLSVRRPAALDPRLLLESFRRWQLASGHLDVCTLDGLIRVERAQAAQGAVLASDAAKARIAGTGP